MAEAARPASELSKSAESPLRKSLAEVKEMLMAKFDSNDPDGAKKRREMFGPGTVDQLVRQAVPCCWMMLPEDRKTVEKLEKQMRRLVDRAFKDLREDTVAFGLRS